MRQITREQIVTFLIDLASPTGPEVFAGFGSELQNERYAWQRSRDDLGGIFEEESQLERVVRDWASNLEPAHALSLLFDIAGNGPGDELGEGLRRRRRTDWDDRLAQLIVAVGSRSSQDLRALIAVHRHRAEMASILANVLESLDEAEK